MTEHLKNGTIVVKVGTSTLTYENGQFNLRRTEALARTLCGIVNSGRRAVLVSSGAIVAGRARLGFGHRPGTIAERQALAAVGQAELMRMYDRFFEMYGHVAAQVLMTRGTVDNPRSRANAENTFRTLLDMNCIPVVNENDTVAFDEIEFGDNDTLSAYVALLCDADALVILSDIDGLYNCDPHLCPDAQLISTVTDIDAVEKFAADSPDDRGTGGLITKLHAARIACDAGIPLYLCNGDDPAIIYDLLDGKNPGTLFLPTEK